MKKLAIAVAAIILSIGLVQASENAYEAKKTKAKVQLRDEINSVLKKVPFNDYVGTKEECRLKLVFRKNEKNLLELKEASGGSQELVDCVERLFSTKKVYVDTLLDSEYYAMKVSFKNMAFRSFK